MGRGGRRPGGDGGEEETLYSPGSYQKPELASIWEFVKGVKSKEWIRILICHI